MSSPKIENAKRRKSESAKGKFGARGPQPGFGFASSLFRLFAFSIFGCLLAGHPALGQNIPVTLARASRSSTVSPAGQRHFLAGIEGDAFAALDVEVAEE